MTKDKAVEKGIEYIKKLDCGLLMLIYKKQFREALQITATAKEEECKEKLAKLQAGRIYRKEHICHLRSGKNKLKQKLRLKILHIKQLQKQIEIRDKGFEEYQKEIWDLKLKIKQLQKENEELKYKPKKRWLVFIDISNPKNKTKIFRVKNKENECGLGHIQWDCGWRQYVFDDGTIKMAEGCQFEVFEKIKELRLERQKLKSK